MKEENEGSISYVGNTTETLINTGTGNSQLIAGLGSGFTHWLQSPSTSEPYVVNVEPAPTMESLEFKMSQLEKMMEHLRDQMRTLAEGDKKHSPRKLGSDK
jgi:hypothetical protein